MHNGVPAYERKKDDVIGLFNMSLLFLGGEMRLVLYSQSFSRAECLLDLDTAPVSLRHEEVVSAMILGLSFVMRWDLRRKSQVKHCHDF